MKDFFSKIYLVIRAITRYSLGIKRNGFEATNSKLDELVTQSHFWYHHIVELDKDRQEAARMGDIKSVCILEQQIRVAVRRFEEEVSQPLANLHRQGKSV